MATAGVPLWSTTADSNNTADPAVNWSEGQAPSSVNNSARAMMASLAKWRDDLYGITAGLTTGGTSTAYTVTTNSTYATAGVMSGAMFSIVPHTTSGAAPTLAVDGLTARALNFSTGVAVPTGALISGTPYLVRYVHATTEFIVIGPSKGPGISADITGATALTDPAVDDEFLIYDLSATTNKKITLANHLKVINALTEDSSPDSAADFLLSYDTSATSAKKVKIESLPAFTPRGYIDGCTLSNGTDATNDIDIAAGTCRDSTNAVDIVLSAIAGKQLDANWAAGATAGMRNSAVGIADGTYHLYAVRTAASSAGDVYAYAGVAGTDPDSSASISTMLTALQAETGGASYAYARRIGSIIRSSAAILAFIQLPGGHFRLKGVPLSINAAAQSTTATLRALTVPMGLKVKAEANVRWVNNAGGGPSVSRLLFISCPDMTDQNPSTSAAPLSSMELFVAVNSGNVTDIGLAAKFTEFTDTSGQWRFDATAAITLYVATVGWQDFRGQDA